MITPRRPTQDPPFFYSLAQALEEADDLLEEVDNALGCAVTDLQDRGSYEGHLSEFPDVVTVLDSWGSQTAPLGAKQLRRAIARAVLERLIGAADVVMYIDRKPEDGPEPGPEPDQTELLGDGGRVVATLTHEPQPLYEEPDPDDEFIAPADDRLAAAVGPFPPVTYQGAANLLSAADGGNVVGLRGPDKPKDAKP